MDRHKLVRGPLCIYIFYLFAVFDLYLVLLVQASYCLYIYTAKNFEKNNTVLTCSLERRSISKRSLHREFFFEVEVKFLKVYFMVETFVW